VVVASSVDLKQFPDLQIRIECCLNSLKISKGEDTNQEFGVLVNHVGNLPGGKQGMFMGLWGWGYSVMWVFILKRVKTELY
jgi:hypothetical protein